MTSQTEQPTPQTELPKSKKKTSGKRVLIEWAVVAALFLFITQTDTGTVVGSWLQRGILWTGVLKPSVELSSDTMVAANYDLPVTHLDGSPARLADLKGKVIFINVWATWCSPCLAEMPFIQKLYETTPRDRIEFVMISVDESREIAQTFIHKREYSFPVYHAPAGLPPPYNSPSIPRTYVISPGGDVVTTHFGMANYNSDAFRQHLLDLSGSIPVSP